MPPHPALLLLSLYLHLHCTEFSAAWKEMHFEHSSRLSDRQTYSDAQTRIASVADQRRFWSKPRSIFNSHSNVSLCFPTSNMFVARARARAPSRNMWIKFCAASKFYVTYFQLRRTLNAMHLNEYNILFNSKVEVFRSRIVCLFTTTICVWFFVLILFFFISYLQSKLLFVALECECSRFHRDLQIVETIDAAAV